MTQLVYGVDPEVFAYYKKDGKLFVLPPVFFREMLEVPVEENGTHPIFARGKNWFVHEDGVAFEFSVNPSTDPAELFYTVASAMEEVAEKILKPFKGFCEPKLLAHPTINYDCMKWIESGPEYIMCTIFGCDPDKDVWGTRTEKIDDVSLHPFRYGGGHVHLSGSAAIIKEPLLAVKCAAITMGNVAIAYSKNAELEKQRTFRYGKPGKYRIQNYKKLWNGIPNTHVGIEYRTPSNSWTQDKELAMKIFEWGKIGMENLLEQGLYKDVLEMLEKPTIEALLNCNQELAMENLKEIERRL